MSFFSSAFTAATADGEASRGWLGSWVASARCLHTDIEDLPQELRAAKQSSSDPAKDQANRSKHAAAHPRFAAEFDGINCFETLVAH